MQPKLDVTQPTPCDLPSPEAIANLEEWNRYTDEQKERRITASARLVWAAAFIRRYSLESSSPDIRHLLNYITNAAVEFLEGR
jgi:hypothetical protein